MGPTRVNRKLSFESGEEQIKGYGKVTQNTEIFSTKYGNNILEVGSPVLISLYRKTCNISRTKSQNLNDSRLILHLSLPNPLKPGVKSRMKMYIWTTSEWSTIWLPIKVHLILGILLYIMCQACDNFLAVTTQL